MILNTVMFREGLGYLSCMRTASVFNGSVSLFSDGKDIRGSVLQEDCRAYYAVVLDDNPGRVEAFSIIVPISKLIEALKDWGELQFEMNIVGGKVVLNCGLKVEFTIFDKNNSHKKLEDIGQKVSNTIMIEEETVKHFSDYFEFTSAPIDRFDNIFIKDKMIVTDTRCVRRYIERVFSFPYVIHLGDDIAKLVSLFKRGFSITCYERAFVLAQGKFTATIAKNDIANSQYEKYLSGGLEHKVTDWFSFKMKDFSLGFKKLRSFLPDKTALMKFDFKENMMVAKVDDHQADFHINFETSNPSFTHKCVNGYKFYSLLSGFKEDDTVKVHTSIDPYPTKEGGTSSFMRFSNSVEECIITPIK